MPSQSKKLGSAEVAAFEVKRDIGAEILQSIRDMKAGKGTLRTMPISMPVRRLRSVSFALFAAIPGASFASIHGDLGLLSILALPIVVFKEAAPLALLAAAYLFWKKRRFGWLVACVATPLAIGLAVRLAVFLAASSGSGGTLGTSSLSLIPYAYAGVDWLFLVVAAVSSKMPTRTEAGGTGATSQETPSN